MQPMRLASTLPRLAAATAAARPAVRHASNFSGSSFASTAYQFVFKRNVTYIAYIVTGAIVLEGVFGTVSQSLWSTMNHGRMYKNTDWSKFSEE